MEEPLEGSVDVEAIVVCLRGAPKQRKNQNLPELWMEPKPELEAHKNVHLRNEVASAEKVC